ncbi:MAG TPA: GYD domain-containing protein [Alphaproteobacteria bacterium]|jgi:uncharacterized protein with GYD domain|nr:GYD domain-containing protein [Alphaproteobacteria bacterium]
MATFILLADYSDQGIRTIKDSPKRLDAARDTAKRFGATIKDFYLCLGMHDIIAIVEADSDDAMAKFALSLGSVGAVRTTTLRAFGEPEYRKIMGELT